ncbi:YtxH domain-containing protein [Flavitalea flava]
MSNQKLLGGLLLGVAVGALAGILLAPKKGVATRKKIIKKSRKYAKGVKDKIHDLSDSVKGRFAQG